MHAPLEFWLPLGAAGLLTLLAMAWDYRLRKIPNALTVPAFVLGAIYQAAFRGWPGLQDAGWGFLIGFGTLFLLWMIGGGGAGDVKFMGALGVWLGAKLITQVLFVSVIFVWFAAVVALILRKSRRSDQASLSKNSPARHMVAFAIPAGLATWLILLVHVLKSQAAG